MNSIQIMAMRRACTVFLFLFCVIFFSGCATATRAETYSLDFDMFTDSPEVEILRYRYGDDRKQEEERAMRSLSTFQQSSITSNFPQRGPLYVRWRVKATGEEYEDTVDLSNRLPQNIDDLTVSFAIKNNRLCVYLVTNERRSPNTPVNGPRRFQYLKVVTIYPDQS